jgi:hypothetical protein
MNVVQLSGSDTEILLQVLNQVPNFLAYSTRRATIEHVADTLQSLTTQLGALRNDDAEPPGVDLSKDEVDAIRLTIPEVIASLGILEFSVRTGYSTTDALTVLDHLCAP